MLTWVWDAILTIVHQKWCITPCLSINSIMCQRCKRQFQSTITSHLGPIQNLSASAGCFKCLAYIISNTGWKGFCAGQFHTWCWVEGETDVTGTEQQGHGEKPNKWQTKYHQSHNAGQRWTSDHRVKQAIRITRAPITDVTDEKAQALTMMTLQFLRYLITDNYTLH